MSEYRVLKNKKYLDHINKLEEIKKTIENKSKAGYREDFIRKEYEEEIKDIHLGIIKTVETIKNEIKNSMNDIEQSYSIREYEDAGLELLKRQDLQAELSMYNDYELEQFIENVDVKELDLYSYKLINDELNKKPQIKDRVSHKMIGLKDVLLYQHKYDNEYQKLENDLAVISTSGIDRGRIMLIENDELVLKDFDKEINNVFGKSKQQ